jgi:predicted transcriptional regulator of viral defense system
VQVSTQVAPLRVSTREATLLDLVRHQSKIGGIEAIARIAQDFSTALTAEGLRTALDAQNNTVSAQRLGFVFDALGQRIHANIVEIWLQGRTRTSIFLSQNTPKGVGIKSNSRWYVRYSHSDLQQLKELL